MSGWQELYDSGKFSINTADPSELVLEYADQIPQNGRIADIGCGAGRNAVFLASRGFDVDASDPIDLDWLRAVTPEVRNRIAFAKASAADIELPIDSYSAAVMMRLIQYLSYAELATLTEKVGRALTVGGLVVASFTIGGTSKIVSDSVSVYKHKPQDVVDGFENHGVYSVLLRTFSTVSKHIPFHSEVEVCELVLRK